MLLIIEHLPEGTLRLGCPSKSGDALFFKRLEERIRTRNDVVSVTSDPFAGQVIVNYSPYGRARHPLSRTTSFVIVSGLAFLQLCRGKFLPAGWTLALQAWWILQPSVR